MSEASDGWRCLSCPYVFSSESALLKHIREEHNAEVRTTSSTGGEKGVKAERFDLIPTGPLAELARHYEAGARKYAAHQYRRGYEWSKSYSALLRHLNAFWGGEDYDVCPSDGHGCDIDMEFMNETPNGRTCKNHTGNHHLAAAAWHCFTLLEFKDRFPEFDDRYKEESHGADNA